MEKRTAFTMGIRLVSTLDDKGPRAEVFYREQREFQTWGEGCDTMARAFIAGFTLGRTSEREEVAQLA